jgi:hypothetical protein
VSGATEAAGRGLSVKLVTARETGSHASPLRLDLPTVYEYTPEFYPTYSLRFPSLLKALELIYDHEPTEIIVSTPGPVGLLGVLASRLFGVPCRGIYQIDPARMAEVGLGGSMAGLVEGYIRWFYHCTDEILVSTEQTRKFLANCGYDGARIRVFRTMETLFDREK